MILRRFANPLLLAVSVSALLTGIAVQLSGPREWAAWIWVCGSTPVLVAVLVGSGRAILRREAGLDLIALLSIAGAMALGEYLTGAVIALMHVITAFVRQQLFPQRKSILLCPV